MTRKILSRAAIGGLLVLAAPFALAQTTTDATTPTAPNTGAGGDMAQNVLLLGASAAAALGAAVYLSRGKAFRS